MNEAQISKVTAKATSVENAKQRLTAAEKSVQVAHDERNAAEVELKLRTLEYESACNEIVGRVHDPCRGPGPHYIR